jgi:hypothetical protein
MDGSDQWHTMYKTKLVIPLLKPIFSHSKNCFRVHGYVVLKWTATCGISLTVHRIGIELIYTSLMTFKTFYGRPKGTKLWTHTQLSPMLVNTMKAHTCNMKRSQKTFEPRANKPNLSHTSRNVTHTIRISHTQVEMLHKKVELSSWGVRQISILIYLGRNNLHIFLHFVYGGRIKYCEFPRFTTKHSFGSRVWLE